MNEEYGTRTLVHILRQRTPTVKGLEHLPNFDCFDVEFSPAGTVLSIARFKGDGSVESTQSFIYECGRLVRSRKVDSSDHGECLQSYEYDTFGHLVAWTARSPSGTVIRRGSNQYEANLLIATSTSTGEGLPVLRKHYEYAEGRRIRSIQLYYSQSGALGERWLSTYDGNERLRETFGLRPDGQPLGDGRYRFEYDSDGRQSKVLAFDEWGDTSTPSSVSEFEYMCDEQGNWIERVKRHRFKNDSRWRTTITTRELTYF